MKFLFISGDSNPFTPTTGSNIRSYYICKSLSELGSVDVICFDISYEYVLKNKEDLAVKNIIIIDKEKFKSKRRKKLEKSSVLIKIFRLLQILFKKDPFYFENADLKKYFKSKIEKNHYDFIFIQRLENAIMTGLIGVKNSLIDIDDHPVDSICSKYLNKSIILRLIAKRKIHNSYYNFIKNQPVVFLSNKNQIKKFNELFLPNLPLDLSIRTIEREPKKNLNKVLFIGALGYPPNYEGLNKFVMNIWPKVLIKYPDCEFHIIGKGLPDTIKNKFKETKNVILQGFVKDLKPFFEECIVSVSPIYSGAGTNIKILESIKEGIPIVATKYSIRGYEDFLQDGFNILIANNYQDFAHKIISLLKNVKLRETISYNAKLSLSNQLYNYESFSDIIKNSIKKINNNEY